MAIVTKLYVHETHAFQITRCKNYQSRRTESQKKDSQSVSSLLKLADEVVGKSLRKFLTALELPKKIISPIAQSLH
jgi:hypothetical protein